ncbi:hypothetical protein [Sphingomonas solaris]|uniref:Uncharacterized protein n=1 Tax=Alterirhizorhabdus solaris TaxID=2529389 RepID=A0A558R8J6_9SPHN|nr:hypothetical protein [Sphingomonas solaris]TVV75648.1 hypothetical protein FOY91_06540 [Sphingomonas solaris]
MSRAINVDVQFAQVQSLCVKHGVDTSVIEALQSGGTRVVFKNADDTAKMKKAFGSKLMTGAVKRVPNRLMHG